MFSVLDEKWVPLVNENGDIVKGSLREVILEAHRYRELSESDSILECALYRFLITFVSDMVYSEYGDDEEREDLIESLLEEGAFSKELFDRYIQLCQDEGTSFDVFDRQRPFMQNGDYEYTDKDIVSVAKLSARAASGTNKLFQSHVAEADFSLSIEDAVLHLLAYSPFNTPGGSGWGSGHYGAYPPVFTYVVGKSLFETLLFNLIENSGTDRIDNKPYWRMAMQGVDKGTEAPLFSTYASMHYPWRFVKLIPDNDLVKTMYYVPGYSIDKTRPDILPDPYATYLPGKKAGETFLFCAKNSSIAWKNISGIFDLTSAPLVVRKYAVLKELLDLNHLSVMTYVTIVKDVHGTFTGAWKNRVSLPSEVLDPSSMILDHMKKAIEYSEQKCWKIHKAGEKVLGKEDYKKRKSMIESYYYASCRNLFFNDFLPELRESEGASMEAWERKVTETALHLYDDQIVSSLSKMEELRIAYTARRLLYS